MLEDEIAQTGQGAIAVRSNEHLGRSDRGVFLLRKIWERELRNLAEGRPVKQWTYRPDMVPTYPQAVEAFSWIFCLLVDWRENIETFTAST